MVTGQDRVIDQCLRHRMGDDLAEVGETTEQSGPSIHRARFHSALAWGYPFLHKARRRSIAARPTVLAEDNSLHRFRRLAWTQPWLARADSATRVIRSTTGRVTRFSASMRIRVCVGAIAQGWLMFRGQNRGGDESPPRRRGLGSLRRSGSTRSAATGPARLRPTAGRPDIEAFWTEPLPSAQPAVDSPDRGNRDQLSRRRPARQ
jgi:hypothetical protein